ncbi:MAG: GTP-binding protein [Gammaproteobacteria bacterium]|nr:GTP-binding protein [Gammaproteobacteria bacterium]
MSTTLTTAEYKDEYDYHFKMVLCGPEGSGKSQLKSCLADNKFKKESKSTFGVEYGSALFYVDKERVRLQMWDPGANPRSAVMGRAYYRGADLLVYCADVTKDTWQTDAPIWFQSDAVQKEKTAGATIVFVATKNNLSAKESNVEVMQKFAAQHEMPFFLTSAKNNKWGNSRATLQYGVKRGLGNALARIALAKRTLKTEEKAKEAIAKQETSVASTYIFQSTVQNSTPNSTPINSLSATGFGLFFLVCSGLTFLPGGPSATGTLILALSGTILLTLGVIGLSVNKWLSNLWNEPNKKAARTITIVALILGVALLVGFAISFGSLPLTQVLADKFADSLGALGIKFIQAALFVSGFFLFLGIGVCACQRYSKSNEVQDYSSAVSRESCSSSTFFAPQATASIPASYEPQLHQTTGEKSCRLG